MVVEREDNISWIDFKIIAFRFSTLFCFLIYLFFLLYSLMHFIAIIVQMEGKNIPTKQRKREKEKGRGRWKIGR